MHCRSAFLADTSRREVRSEHRVMVECRNMVIILAGGMYLENRSGYVSRFHSSNEMDPP